MWGTRTRGPQGLFFSSIFLFLFLTVYLAYGELEQHQKSKHKHENDLTFLEEDDELGNNLILTSHKSSTVARHLNSHYSSTTAKSTNSIISNNKPIEPLPSPELYKDANSTRKIVRRQWDDDYDEEGNLIKTSTSSKSPNYLAFTSPNVGNLRKRTPYNSDDEDLVYSSGDNEIGSGGGHGHDDYDDEDSSDSDSREPFDDEIISTSSLATSPISQSQSTRSSNSQSSTTIRSDTSFQKRFFRVTLTIGKSWSPALQQPTSSTFGVYQSELEEALKSSTDIYPESLHVVQFINIHDPSYVRCRFDIGLIGESLAYVENELKTYVETGSIGSLRVKKDAFSVLDVGAPLEPVCNEGEIVCEDGECYSHEIGCPEQKHSQTTQTSPFRPTTTHRPLRPPTTGRLIPPIIPVDNVPVPIAPGQDLCRADDQVRCHDGTVFVCSDQICDGVSDCPDSSDEENCNDDCQPGFFSCDLNKCISSEKRCNGVQDCLDASDENDCFDTQNCLDFEFKCKNGDCILKELTCNHRVDCILDASDEDIEMCSKYPYTISPSPYNTTEIEITSPNSFNCEIYQYRCRDGTCILKSKRCDGTFDCPDRTDERPYLACACDNKTEFRCASDLCIPLSQVCDKIRNCADGGDELNCTNRGCSSNEFECLDGSCIDLSKKCNKRRDCAQGEDEHSCPVTCSHDQYLCPSKYPNNTYICLSIAKRCDSIEDCPRGEDEIGCNRPKPCSSDKFQCADGSCILKYLECDNYPDCLDGSDETFCKTICNGMQFQCSDNVTCIPKSQICNGYPECQDGLDEKNCSAVCDQNMFLCKSGGCVDRTLVCDYIPDCLDFSDEENCDSPGCRDGEFKCGDSSCIPDYLRCDGKADCRNLEDEENCDQCRNSFLCSNGKCIDTNLVCNGRDDCDGHPTDEADCVRTCSSEEFRCTNGDCIPKKYKCDSYADCVDQSDEIDEICRPLVPVCGPSQFRCQTGGFCIDESKVCNRAFDCMDGSDEVNCQHRECQPGYFRCILSSECILLSKRCDRRIDCLDRSDEQDCPQIQPPVPHQCQSHEFTCKSGRQCVPISSQCNGVYECNDYSDEDKCDGPPGGLSLKTYPTDQTIKQGNEVVFQCRDEGPQRASVRWIRGNGLPLPEGSRDYNGRLEMPEIKVEHSGTFICEAIGFPPSTPGSRVSVFLRVDSYEPPPTRPPTACGIHEATCGSGECISKALVCDGDLDCQDGSDELRCKKEGMCEPNEFQCYNKRCVPKTWRCDGDDDCSDNSDEEGCTAPPPGSECRYSEFRCATGNQCIPKAFHCDKELDCSDNSDESGCSAPVIIQPPPPLITIEWGETLNITCRAIGIPIAEIVWRRNWGHVPDKCFSSSQNGFGILTCGQIQIGDQGAYSCEAINNIGSTFAIPDCQVIVKKQSICRDGYFNSYANSSRDCLPCFCFGHTSQCDSVNLYYSHLPPPENNYRLIGITQDGITGGIEIHSKKHSIPPSVLRPAIQGVQISTNLRQQFNVPSEVIPYFVLPPNYNGNMLRSYGGYFRYTLKYKGTGRSLSAPDVIIQGNGLTLIYASGQNWSPGRDHQVSVRFWAGEWFKKVYGRPSGELPAEGIEPASREEILLVLSKLELLLIRAQYEMGTNLDTEITHIRMDTAIESNNGQSIAHLVESCFCPAGYTGLSCETCAPGYERKKQGPWLGTCEKIEASIRCANDEYMDYLNRCRPCPCPGGDRKFGSSCYLDTDNQVTCNCNYGHIGRNCEQCNLGFEQSQDFPYDCRPVGVKCDTDGSESPFPDPQSGRCVCKNFATGILCNECKPKTFFLSSSNQYGCVSCFCMGITDHCTSSNWYRAQEIAMFINSAQGFTLVDQSHQNTIQDGWAFNRDHREIGFRDFSRHAPKIYYWSLPFQFLGDKSSSYGGFLNYTVRYVPPPGGQNSPNSAADIEISGNEVRLFYFRKIPIPVNKRELITVPLLEQYWQRQDGQVMNREHFLMALANIDALLIKATYTTTTKEAFLSDVIMDYAVPRNTGQERAYAVESCNCAEGYTGLSCQECAYGYTRSLEGLYLSFCEPCSCNGNSDECEPKTGICRNCKNHTTGDFCEECESGYIGDPRHGGCELEIPRCFCDMKGSQGSDCPDGRNCVCKANTIGANCNQCRPGTFSLQEINPSGCFECFCSKVSPESECSVANLYRSTIDAYLYTNPHEFVLTDNLRTNTIQEITLDPNSEELVYKYPSTSSPRSDRIFWSLPSKFTGNRIASYGGKLKATRRYYVKPGSDSKPIEDIDVILIGNNGISVYWIFYGQILSGQEVGLEVELRETSGWRHLDGPGHMASREDLLGVLVDLQAILIRATFTDDMMESTHIKSISLDDAIRQPTPNGIVIDIEECRCPKGYEGYSCESCSSGYYLDVNDRSGGVFGKCRECPCGENSEGCRLESQNSRPICFCKPGYSGASCEKRDRVVVELMPIKVKTRVGKIEEFSCSYESRLRLRIEFDTYPKWDDLSHDDYSQSLTPQDNNLLDEFFPNPQWTNKLIARIPILSPLRKVICRISNEEGGTVAEVYAKIEPVGGPSLVTPSPPSQSQIQVSISEPIFQIVEIGRTVSFRCSARSITGAQLRVSWEKENGYMPSGRSRDDGQGLLLITDTRSEDAGTYNCKSTDGYTVVKERAQLTIGGSSVTPSKPEVAINPRFLSVSVGEPVEFTCTSFPQSRITWSGGPSGVIPPHANVYDGVLRIAQTRKSDEGEYFCTGSNSYGSTMVRTVLYVQGEDSRPPIIPPQFGFVVTINPPEYEARPGEPVRFKCDCSEPQGVIQWARGVGVLPSSATQSPDGILSLYSVRDIDSGVYICTCLNNEGQSKQAQARLIVSFLGSPPTAKIEQERQTVAQGNPIEIKCLPSGNPAPTIQWSKVGGSLPPHIQTTHEILRISSAQMTDRGVYVCTVESSGGKSLTSAIVEVERREAPQIEMYPSPKQIVVRDGSALFQCRIIAGIPSPLIKWTRADGHRIPPNVEQIQGGVLRFNRVTGDEKGQYICEASSLSGTTTAIATLEVQSPPKLTINQPNPLRVQTGERVRLECRAEGDPLPSVSWKKLQPGKLDGIDLFSTTAHGTPQSAIYQIERVSKHDESSYSCVGQNAAGMDEARIQLLVDDILQPTHPDHNNIAPPPHQVHPPNPREEIYYFPVGSRAELRCIQGGFFEQLFIEWERPDGGGMPSDYEVRDGILYINDVQPSDQGHYQCKGTSLYKGEVVLTVDVRLEVVGVSPPRIVLHPPRQVVRRGALVNISCIAHGDQPITINWYKTNHHQFPPSVIVNGPLLTFRGIEVSDAGMYSCQATNRGGTAESVAEVIVNSNGPPAPRPQRREQIGFVGSNLDLRCLVVGQRILWTKDGGALPNTALQEGNLLKIFNLQLPDAGRYTCENDDGISDFIDLSVEVKPYGEISRCSKLEWECDSKDQCISLHMKCDKYHKDCTDGSDESEDNCPNIDSSNRIKRGVETIGVRIHPDKDLLRVGDDLEVKCEVTGDPDPHVKWTKVRGEFADNVITQDDKLRVLNIVPQNGGVYRCTVQTHSGIYEEDYALAIQITPGVQNSAPIETKSAPLGSTVMMDCRTDLEGPIEYAWSKQGGLIPSAAQSAGPSLTIPDLNPEDSGVYICSAKSSQTSMDIPTVLVVTGVVPHFAQAPTSYLTLPTLPDSYLRFDIEISFKPEDKNGMILYNGQKRDGSGDFISFGITNGVPEYRFDLGTGPIVIKGEGPIKIGSWHTVKLNRDKTEGSMIVDEGGPIFGSSRGNLQGLDLIEPMYIGGVPNFSHIHRLSGFTRGFVGCISELIISSKKQQLLRDLQTSRGVQTCDTCTVNTCTNGGVCQESLSKRGFNCICPSGYSGDDCQTIGQSCYVGACGVGKCVNVAQGFDCYCPFGKSGIHCERDIIVTEPAFGGDSFISYPTPKALKKLKMSIRVKPHTLEDSVLMYSSQTEDGMGDYATIIMKNGRIEFQYDTGSGPAILQSQRELVPGVWVTISIDRNLQEGELIIDGQSEVKGKSPGTTRGLNLKTPLYIGGYDRHRLQLNPNIKTNKGFAGCISELVVFGMELDLVNSVMEGANIENCGVNPSECPDDNNPCKNDAICRSNTTRDSFCECKQGFIGRHCEFKDTCFTKPCLNGGTCHIMEDTYKCACYKGYHGRNCQEVHLGEESVAFRGEGYLELNSQLLPHTFPDEQETIELEISTTKEHGLVFWHGQKPIDIEPGDYLSVGIHEGKIEFEWDVGNGPAKIISPKRINDGKKHKIILKRQGSDGSIEIDNELPEYGNSPGLAEVLDAHGNIYIGGVPNPSIMTYGKYSDGFIGCINSLKINQNHTINLFEEAINAVNTGPCSRNPDENSIIGSSEEDEDYYIEGRNRDS